VYLDSVTHLVQAWGSVGRDERTCWEEETLRSVAHSGYEALGMRTLFSLSWQVRSLVWWFQSLLAKCSVFTWGMNARLVSLV
jgi:hypothetical protein